jgi:DNA-binding PadR family transcriptional regulator
MSLRHALLGLLARGPASGYDLMRTFNTTLSHVWSATQSQVYTDLTRLDTAGQIRIAAEGPRGRKTYEITDAGRRELRHWLLEVEPEGPRRNETLLRVFLLGTVEPDEARDFLLAREAVARRRHEEYVALDEKTEWSDNALALYGRLTLEWGKRLTAMHADWSVWAVAELDKARGKTSMKRD